MLLLFLFPMVEKHVHAFEHSKDKHCTANEKHFHEEEHHCTICDFTITDSNPGTGAGYQFITSSQQFIFSVLPESIYLQGAHYNLPARAPPVA